MKDEAMLTDDLSSGFVDTPVSSNRYSSCNLDPQESHGLAAGFVGKGERVLDVGCGSGQFALALQGIKQCLIIGIEPNPERFEAARMSGIKVVPGYLGIEAISKLPPEDRVFDTVMFMDVLEHATDPLCLLDAALDCLAPSGKILISVPNVAHWTVRLSLMRGNFNYQETGIMDATHLRWFTQKTIRDLAQKAGLKVEYQNVSRGYWLPAYSSGKIWRRIPRNFRNKVINCLCEKFPGLFGCQHFLVASR